MTVVLVILLPHRDPIVLQDSETTDGSDKAAWAPRVARGKPEMATLVPPERAVAPRQQLG